MQSELLKELNGRMEPQTPEAAAEIAPEAEKRVEAAVLKALGKRERKLKRSLDLSTGFYNALAGLSATSIAVGVTAGVALMGKTTALAYIARGISHAQIVHLIILLWGALMLAVTHNLIVVLVSYLDVRYASAEISRVAIRESYNCLPKLAAPEEQRKLEETFFAAQEPFRKRQAHAIASTRCLLIASFIVGMIAIVSFLLAYSLVVFRVVKLFS